MAFGLSASTIIGVGSSLVGGLMSSGSSQSAGNTQAAADNAAAKTQWDIFNTQNEQQAPYRDAGKLAISSLLGGEGLGPATGGVNPNQFTGAFNASDLDANLAPNWKFQLDQGLGATKNAANLQTGLLSGNALRGINDYAQNYAGNAYQQAFNNYQTNQTNIFNRLASIAGYGQTANAQMGQLAANTGNNVGSAQMASGAAQAAGTIGSANAISGALNNASSWYNAGSGGGGGGYGGGSFDGNVYNGGSGSMGWVSGSDLGG